MLALTANQHTGSQPSPSLELLPIVELVAEIDGLNPQQFLAMSTSIVTSAGRGYTSEDKEKERKNRKGK